MARGGTSFEEMKERRDEVKAEFQVTRCKKCGTKETAPWWDIDMASMVNRIGEPWSAIGPDRQR